jgi:hypothetical protein
MRKTLFITFLLFNTFTSILFGQEKLNFFIPWENPDVVVIDGVEKMQWKANGIFVNENGTPAYWIELPFPNIYNDYELINPEFMMLPDSWMALISSDMSIPSTIIPEKINFEIQRRTGVGIQLMPIRKNETGQVEILISGTIIYRPEIIKQEEKDIKKSVTNSVLATGSWIKLGIIENGVYKVTYENLLNTGLISGNVPSSSIRLYGNGGRMLPEPNIEWRADDLTENAIQVVDGGDGQWNAGDYFLFYGKAPHEWNFNTTSKKYEYQHHIYSDSTYYFITVQGNNGKRINSRPSLPGTADYITQQSDDYAVINDEKYNLVKSGRRWMGDYMNFNNSYDYQVQLPNIISGSTINFRLQYAARCVSCTSNLITKWNGNSINNLNIPGASPSYTAPYAILSTVSATAIASTPSNTIEVTRQTGQEAWIDFIEFNYRKTLTPGNEQFHFMDSLSIGKNIVRYELTSSVSGIQIWDVSDFINPEQQSFNTVSNQLIFQTDGDTLREFISFSPSSIKTPTLLGLIPNQNLHALTHENPAPELVIITHPAFLSAAQRLADHHLMWDGMKVHTVTIDQVYNEFSSGAQDVTAIRDFIKMYADNHLPGEGPSYALLFGDGSYDFKDYLGRTENNTNFVPAFESLESFDRGGNSYPSDDFFGIIGPNEGITGKIQLGPSQTIDVGIGRIPARTLDEAQGVVDKIVHYATAADCKRDWRNDLLIIADDMEAGWEGSFFSNSESISNQVKNNFPEYNVDKLYLDAFQQVTNAGQRYPEANTYFENRINKGCLLMNYIGHGGESGITSERLLGINDIPEWNNKDAMPAFSTATCTFTRFDNPEFLSAGELILLRKGGGGIALFSTVRAISIVPNFNFKFFNAAFSPLPNGKMPRLGDIIRLAKQPGNDFGEQNILLFGDPAMQLAYPSMRVVTDEINGITADTSVTLPTDTMKASEFITIKGHIENIAGNTVTDFNGTLYITIFDKASQLSTQANDPAAVVFNFELQKNIIFKGKATVSNGFFEVSFIVPLDINYLMGKGKISYYAENGILDAHGYYDNFMVGGSEDNCFSDANGPEIELFLNDTNFIDGGICNNDPTLFIKVKDINGINTVGNGIGHDILAYFNGQTSNAILLNQYYEADLDDYTSGTVRYPLSDLPEGTHYIVVQVWDGCNNFSMDTIRFNVTGEISIINMQGFPNPFNEQTTISFEHNLAGSNINYDIDIIDLQGKIVKNWKKQLIPDGFREISVTWDGRNADGAKQKSGMYIARVTIANEQQEMEWGTCKLILIN